MTINCTRWHRTQTCRSYSCVLLFIMHGCICEPTVVKRGLVKFGFSVLKQHLRGRCAIPVQDLLICITRPLLLLTYLLHSYLWRRFPSTLRCGLQSLAGRPLVMSVRMDGASRLESCKIKRARSEVSVGSCTLYCYTLYIYTYHIISWSLHSLGRRCPRWRQELINKYYWLTIELGASISEQCAGNWRSEITY